MQETRETRENARKFQRNIYSCIIDYAKAFVCDCVCHNKLWKILKKMGILDNLTCPQRNLHADQEATEPDMEEWTGLKLGKEYVKHVYCHPAYLTYMQSISCKMMDWIQHKQESGLQEKYQ